MKYCSNFRHWSSKVDGCETAMKVPRYQNHEVCVELPFSGRGVRTQRLNLESAPNYLHRKLHVKLHIEVRDVFGGTQRTLSRSVDRPVSSQCGTSLIKVVRRYNTLNFLARQDLYQSLS